MICFLVALSLVKAVEEVKMASFDINLDESPETRWLHVMEAKKVEIKKFVAFFEYQLNPFLIKYISYSLLKTNIFPSESLSEMQGSADYLKIDFNTVVALNFINEFYSKCSSLIIRKQQNGIILGRNLDYDFPSIMRELSIDLSFYKSGKLLYKSASGAIYFGVVTGMRPGSYALSINQRDLFDHAIFWESLNLFEGSKATTFAMRYSLENIESYEEAKKYLENIPLIAGEYICITGTTDGSIITRNRKYVADLREIDEYNWYIVQTNYDHWLPQPIKDDRYHPAIKRIEEVGKDSIDEDQVHRIMTMTPTYNWETVHTVIANPLTGYWYAVTWPFDE